MQYGKVEICGVNTSQLKLLKESEKRELLNIIKNGSPAEKKKARDKMINGRDKSEYHKQRSTGSQVTAEE